MVFKGNEKNPKTFFTLNAKHQSYKVCILFRFQSIFGDSSPEALFNQIGRSPGTYWPVFIETFNGPWGLWEVWMEYLQDAELLKDADHLQDLEHLQDRLAFIERKPSGYPKIERPSGLLPFDGLQFRQSLSK